MEVLSPGEEIIVLSDIDDSETETMKQNKTKDLPPLQPVSIETNVILNGKEVSRTLDRSNFDFEKSYFRFQLKIDGIIAVRTKLDIQVISNARKVLRWK